MNFQSLTTSPRSEATFHDFRSRHHSRSAITQLAAGFYYFFLFFFLHLGETLSRMGSSTIFQRSYSKTRTFSNFRSSRFIPHPPSLLLVLAIEIKSASITTVPLLKNDEVTLLFFLFFFLFFCFLFFFHPSPQQVRERNIYWNGFRNRYQVSRLTSVNFPRQNLYTLRLRVCIINRSDVII